LVGALGATLAAQALPQAGGGIDLAAAPRRAFVVSLQLAAAIVLGLPVVAVTQLFLPKYVAPLTFAAVLAALAVRLWKSAELLQAGDVLALAGTHDSVDAARALLSDGSTEQPPPSLRTVQK